MSDREVFRLAPPVVFWWLWLAFVTANVIDYAVQGLPSARFGAVVAAVLLLVTGLAYTLALRPRVLADAGGLTVVNPYRVHRLPWTRVESVDAAQWVSVRPASGKAVYCWALYVSAGARRKTARVAARSARPARPARSARPARPARPARFEPGAGEASGRLPEEARYLASLPPAKAIAIRLDKRAARERGRAGSANAPGAELAVTATWSWHALAAVVVPALVLLIVALA